MQTTPCVLSFYFVKSQAVYLSFSFSVIKSLMIAISVKTGADYLQVFYVPCSMQPTADLARCADTRIYLLIFLTHRISEPSHRNS